MNDFLHENPVFVQKSSEYQYYKLIRVMLRFTPVTVNGDNPPSGFIVFLGNEDLNTINYTDLPYLNYKRAINPTRVSRHVFTRPGRQADFNYWYNTGNTTGIDAYFKIRLDEDLNSSDGYYKLDIGMYVIFDKPIYQSQNKTKEEGQIIKSEFQPSVEEINTENIRQTIY